MTMSFRSTIRHPSAFLPVLMSLGAIATLVIHIARFGVTREADEGAAAHIWQLLMAAQAPIILFFAVHWLPKNANDAWRVLALQIAAALAAIAPVFILKL